MRIDRHLLKRGLLNLLLIAVSLAAGLLLTEAMLAVFYPQGIRKILTGQPFYGRFDAELGWANKPDAEGTLQGGRIRINSNGLRGPDYPYAKTPGRKRVFILGDSITFGYGLDLENTYPFLLQEMLGKGYEVINGGVIGYGTDQEYLFFRREGIKYLPDLLIVGISAGDFYDLQCSMRYGKHKPFFRLINGDLVLHNSPVPEKKSIQELFFRDKKIHAYLFSHSHLYRFLFYKFKDINRAMDVNIEALNNIEKIQVASGIIRRLQMECDKIGCSLLFAVIPQEDWIKDHRQQPENEMFRRAQQGVVGIIDDSDIPFLDLWEPFLEHIDEGLFLPGDPVHTNRNGNKIIAGQVYEMIRGLGE